MQLVIFGGLTFGIAFIATVAGLAIVASLNHLSLMDLTSLKSEDFAKPEFTGIVRGFLIVQFLGFFLLPSLIFAYLADPRPLHFCGLKKPDRSGFIFLGILIMLCSYMMVEWLGIVNQQLVQNLLGKNARQWIEKGESDVNGTLQNILNMKNVKDLLVSIFFVGILAAIGEEIFFRGILQRIFIQVFRNPWWGIIVTAAIFSAIHGQFLGFIPRMVLGIILGALYWYSGSLWTSIAGHLTFNGLQILLVYYNIIDTSQQTAGINNKYLSIIGIFFTIIVVLLLTYLRKRSVTSYPVVYSTES